MLCGGNAAHGIAYGLSIDPRRGRTGSIESTVLAHCFLVVSSLSVLVLGLAACGGSSSVSSLNAAGASFPAKVYQSWFADMAGSGGIKVNYQGVGSGAGRKAFIDGTGDFAASDDPIKAADRKQVSQGAVQIPMVGGTIAFGYNKPGCQLQLTQQQAVGVATGTISDSKELGCDAGTITWVHRSDGSGTTKAFTNSMQTFSPDWTLGSGKSVKWPVGVGANCNSGVAGVIDNRVGAIGYVNQSHIRGKVKAAAVQNKSGEFLKPSVEAGAKALNGIELDEHLAGSNPNPEAAGAYPIATLTWVLAYAKGNGTKADAVREVFNHMLEDSTQERAAALGFVPLRGTILEKSRRAVVGIQQ